MNAYYCMSEFYSQDIMTIYEEATFNREEQLLALQPWYKLCEYRGSCLSSDGFL